MNSLHSVERGKTWREERELISPVGYLVQVTLEWRITGLKAMFESTKGDAKSKCIKVSRIRAGLEGEWS
jgi:hypothetical protein